MQERRTAIYKTEIDAAKTHAELDALEAELRKLDADIERAAIDDEINLRTKVVTGQIPSVVVANARSQQIPYLNDNTRSEAKMAFANEREEARASIEYREAFFSAMMGRAPEKRELLTTIGAAAVVPVNTFNQIVENIQKVSGLLGHIRILQIPGKLSVPLSDIHTPATWHEEGAEIAASNLPPSSVSLEGHTLGKMFSMSVATQSMSIAAFEAYLIQELTRCTRDALAQVIFDGTGVGQPTGILSGTTWGASNSIAVAAGASLWEALGTAMSLLASNYRQGAVFVMNSQMLYSFVAVQKDSAGRPIFTQDMANGLPLSLMGKPIVVDDFCQDNVILFGDPRFYFMNFSQPMAVERSAEAGFSRGTILYRSLAVCDGKPVAPAFVRIVRTV
jgi:HK97 family phage major capsid protein